MGDDGQGTRFDFGEYLQAHPSYRDGWLDGLRFVHGDLEIGDLSIAGAPPDEREECRSIAIERHVAARWLEGDHATYSQVTTDTILLGR